MEEMVTEDPFQKIRVDQILTNNICNITENVSRHKCDFSGKALRD